MKNFKTILGFELGNYFKSKSYVISTLLICLVCAIIMFVPRFINSDDKKDNDKEISSENTGEDEKKYMALYDKSGIVDMELLAGYFPGVEFKLFDNAEDVKKTVEAEEAEAGYVVNSLTDYDYYVFNRSMFDENTTSFTEFMSMSVKMNYCDANGLDRDEFLALEYAEINVNENVLGKGQRKQLLLLLCSYHHCIYAYRNVRNNNCNGNYKRKEQPFHRDTCNKHKLNGSFIRKGICRRNRYGISGWTYRRKPAWLVSYKQGILVV